MDGSLSIGRSYKDMLGTCLNLLSMNEMLLQSCELRQSISYGRQSSNRSFVE